MQERIKIPGEPKRRWFSSDDFDLIVRFATMRNFESFDRKQLICLTTHQDHR